MSASPENVGVPPFDSGPLPPRPISLSMIGVSANDRRQLLDAFEEIPDDRILYRPVALHQRPDILLVNADDARSLATWVRYRNYARQLGAEPPSVVISGDRTFDTAHYQLTSPLDGHAALRLFNRIVSERLTVKEIEAPQRPPLSVVYSPPLDETALPPRLLDMNPSADESLPLASAANDMVTPDVDLNVAAVRALVIDDSLPVRIQMKQALHPLGWQVDFAESGENALPLLDNNDYNIIFVDTIMPNMDGYEVCRYAKEGRAKDVPVVMLTSASSPADRVRGKLAGCDTYLIKPVTPQVLRQLLEQYLSVR